MIVLRMLEDANPKDKLWQCAQRLAIGRSSKAEVVLDDASVSRNHAEIVLNADGWMLRDVGSTNGTFLNSTRVGRAEVALQEGDIIQIGRFSLLVESTDETRAGSRGEALGIRVVNSLTLGADETAQPPGLGKYEGLERSLVALGRIGRNFYSLDSIEAFLESTLWEIAEAFDAHQGAFFLRDDNSKRLRHKAVFSLDGKAPAPCQIAVAEWALRQQKTLLCEGIGANGAGRPEATNSKTGPRLILGFLRSTKDNLGVFLLARSDEQEAFGDKELLLAEILSHGLSTSIQSLYRQFSRQRDLYVQTLTTLAHLIQLRNNCSTEYSDRVTDYALLIAETMKLPENDRYLLKIGTPLRDLGKIGIPDTILEKPGKLTAQEMASVKTHVAKGVAILESIPFLVPLVPMIRSHHEHWDGGGYPDGISGEQIPILSRIVAVADALDAMTSPRPFRQALCLEAAFVEIRSRAGSQFDPACVEALVSVRPQIEEIIGERQLLPQTYSLENLRKILAEEDTADQWQRLPERKSSVGSTPLPPSRTPSKIG